MTKAQQTYERIEALVEEGATRADAFKTLAAELDRSVDSVRGAYYTGRKAATGERTGSPSRSRRRHSETSAEDAITAAVASLTKSIATIEREVEDALQRAQEAEREFQALNEAAKGKIEAIRAKIEALSAQPN